jgi:hypothetical protein
MQNVLLPDFVNSQVSKESCYTAKEKEEDFEQICDQQG